ncbi:hypothetical protein [Streptomyces sp. NPDC005141]
MPELRVHNITVSVDGYAAGPHQRLEHPLGDGAAGSSVAGRLARPARASLADPRARLVCR